MPPKDWEAIAAEAEAEVAPAGELRAVTPDAYAREFGPKPPAVKDWNAIAAAAEAEVAPAAPKGEAAYQPTAFGGWPTPMPKPTPAPMSATRAERPVKPPVREIAPEQDAELRRHAQRFVNFERTASIPQRWVSNPASEAVAYAQKTDPERFRQYVAMLTPQEERGFLARLDESLKRGTQRVVENVGDFVADTAPVVRHLAEEGKDERLLHRQARGAMRGADVIPASGWVERGVQNVVGMVPAITASTFTGGPVGAVAFWTAQIAPERYEEYVAKGVKPNVARAGSLASAIPEALVEILMGKMIGGPKGFGQLFRGGKEAVKQTAGRGVKKAMEAAAHGLWEYGKELAEEPTQAAIKQSVQFAMSEIDRESPGFIPADAWEDIKQNTVEAVLPLALMMGAPAALGAVARKIAPPQAQAPGQAAPEAVQVPGAQAPAVATAKQEAAIPSDLGEQVPSGDVEAAEAEWYARQQAESLAVTQGHMPGELLPGRERPQEAPRTAPEAPVSAPVEPVVSEAARPAEAPPEATEGALPEPTLMGRRFSADPHVEQGFADLEARAKTPQQRAAFSMLVEEYANPERGLPAPDIERLAREGDRTAITAVRMAQEAGLWWGPNAAEPKAQWRPTPFVETEPNLEGIRPRDLGPSGRAPAPEALPAPARAPEGTVSHNTRGLTLAQLALTQDRVKTLGSLDAVDAAYGGDSDVHQYARQYARNIDLPRTSQVVPETVPAPPAPASPGAAGKAKEPWQMPIDEYMGAHRDSWHGHTAERTRDIQQQFERAHERSVQQAVKDGKPVTAEVLRQYRRKPWAKVASAAPAATPGPPKGAEGQRPAEVSPEATQGTAEGRVEAAGGATISDFLAGRRSGTVATLTDARTPADRISLVLMPDTSNVGTYSIVAKTDRGSQTFRMQYRGGEPLSDVLAHFADYLNTDLASKEFSVTPIEQKLPKPVVPLTADQVDKARIKELKAVRFKTAGQEKSIELLEARLKADPSKWAVGDGVGHRVAGQITRGYRIVDIDPATKEATISIVADTGLADAGIGDSQRVHIGDLVRDNRFNAPPSQGVPRGAVPAAEQRPGGKDWAAVAAQAEAEVAGTVAEQAARVTDALPRMGELGAGVPLPFRPSIPAPQGTSMPSVPGVPPAPRPEIEGRYQDAANPQRIGLGGRVLNGLSYAWKALTRPNVNIPPAPLVGGKDPHASFREFVRLIKGVGKPQVDQATRNIASYYTRLTKEQAGLFTRYLILKDAEEAAGRLEPFRHGWTAQDFQDGTFASYLSTVEGAVNADPVVAEAVRLRQAIAKEVRDAAQALDVLPPTANRDWYFHHYITSLEEQGGEAGAIRPRVPRPAKRTWQKGRVKGEEALDAALDPMTDFPEPEARWMSEALIETRKAELLRDMVNSTYNQREALAAEAKARNAASPTAEPITWHDLVREKGLAVWQPVPGNFFYKTWSVPDQLAQDVLASGGIEVKIPPEVLRQIIAFGGPREEYVLPKNMVAALDGMVRVKPPNAFQKLVMSTHNAWKAWVTALGPKFIPFNIRNLLGDADAAIAGAPGVLRYVPNSLGELHRYYTGNLVLSPTMRSARDLNVLSSAFAAEDLPGVKDLAMFRRFYSHGGMLKADVPVTETLRKFAEFREGVLRYSAFLHYRNMLKSGKLAHYGTSSKATVDALVKEQGVDVAAAHMSRNLLGDYGNLTVFGDWMRRYVMPFWSFQEINLKRYPKMFLNAAQAGKLGGNGKAATLVTSALLVARIAWLYGAFALYNRVFHKREEDRLSAREKAQPHIIFGTRPDGSIAVFNRAGAVGDFLEWFGINTLAQRLEEFRNNQIDAAQLVKEMLSDPFNKFLQGIRPDIKGIVEVSMGKSLFPDVANPRTTPRDEIAAGIWGAADWYKELKGRLTGSGERARPGQAERLLYGISDPNRNALSEIYELRSDFLRSIGKDVPSDFGGASPWRTIREAAQNGDYGAFKDAFLRYVESGKDMIAFNRALGNLDPIANRLNDTDEHRFVYDFLTPPQRETLKVARDYAQRLRDTLVVWRKQFVEENPGAVQAALNAYRKRYAPSAPVPAPPLRGPSYYETLPPPPGPYGRP